MTPARGVEKTMPKESSSIPATPWWHASVLDGTETISVRTHSDFCWPAFINTRSKLEDMGRSLDRLVWQMARSVAAWHP
jgi:hypothetical protein